VLKTLEGAGKYMSHFFRTEFEKSLGRKIGYFFSREVFAKMRTIADYREYGGAPLLGINGVVIISHGGSDAIAVQRAVAQGQHLVEVGLSEAIASVVTEHAELFKRRKHSPNDTNGESAGSTASA